MLVVDAIAGRRLPVPRTFTGDLIATVSVGSATIRTDPAKPVSDAKLGVSVAFRDRLEIPIQNPEEHAGVLVTIGSTDGTLDFGEGVCTESKRWHPLQSDSGEVLCAFTVIGGAPTPAAGTPKQSKRPATAGPGAPTAPWAWSASSQGQVSKSGATRSPQAATHQPQAGYDWTGALTLVPSDVQGLSIPASRASIFVVFQFAMHERHSTAVNTSITANGHAAVWTGDAQRSVTYDLHPGCLNTAAKARIYGNFHGRESQYLGEAVFSLELDTDSEEKTIQASVTDHPRSVFTIRYTVAYHEPQREGSHGRPLSAYSRNGRHAVPSPLRAGALQSSDESVGGAAQADLNSASKLRTRVASERTVADDGPLLGSAAMERVEQRISSVVSEVVSQVMGKLSVLESRVTKVEESVSQLKGPARPGTGGHRSNTRPGSGYSRPGSADSGPSYDVSQSAVTEVQLRAKFKAMDRYGSGYITKGQLLAFYRRTSTGEDEPDDTIVRFAKSLGVGGIEHDTIGFDDFAKVALKLAQR